MDKYNAISTLLILKHEIITSAYVNETRQGEYGRGFKDAIDFVKETIDKDTNEYMNEVKENDRI